MDRIQRINPKRIHWCCEDRGISIEELPDETGIAATTLEKTLKGEPALTFNQLRKLAAYFNRGLLFFLDAAPVDEKILRSQQFRTIANERPDLSPSIKSLIERVELHRDTYLALCEELEEQDSSRYQAPTIPKNPRDAATFAREWLQLNGHNSFASYRAAVELRGILVIRSMGYQGAWRIPPESQIIGFSLYHPACPVIVVRKQPLESRQVFTLMHELGHILMHQASQIDEEEDLYSREGRESQANSFAGNILVPDEVLKQIDDHSRPRIVSDYPGWLQGYTKQLGISTEVILRRLLDAGRLGQSEYDAYRAWRADQPSPVQAGGTRQYRYREPLKIFGPRFVSTVLDALHARLITMNKASLYLDNLKVKDIHALEEYLAGL